MEKCSASALLMAGVRSLRFQGGGAEFLQSIPLEQWGEFLALTDEARITLPIVTRYRNAAPEPVRQWLDECVARNAHRHERIVEAHAALADAMNSHGADFIVLKGLSHERFWPAESRCRPQYDIDLYCPRESVPAAREAAALLGYEPVRATEPDADHLPVMIRQTGWRWRGDYYDPEQPLALEIHHRFWNPTLGFSVRSADRFQVRLCFESVDGVTLPMLDRVDALDYAAWHAVRHLLRGTLKIFHVYEIAQYLDRSADDDGFWKAWQCQGCARRSYSRMCGVSSGAGVVRVPDASRCRKLRSRTSSRCGTVVPDVCVIADRGGGASEQRRALSPSQPCRSGGSPEDCGTADFPSADSSESAGGCSRARGSGSLCEPGSEESGIYGAARSASSADARTDSPERAALVSAWPAVWMKSQISRWHRSS